MVESLGGVVIVDFGSQFFKAGLSDRNGSSSIIHHTTPSIVDHNVVASYASKSAISLFPQQHYVGTKGLDKRGIKKLSRPVDRGKVREWDDLERVMAEIYSELNIASPEEHPLFICEPISVHGDGCNENWREKMISLAFEKFQVPELYFENQGVLALYSVGKTSGICLEMGHEITQSIAVLEGKVLESSFHVELGGKDISEALMGMLRKTGLVGAYRSDYDIVNDVKEKLCYIPNNFEEEIVKAQDYELPCGNMLHLESELIKPSETLFNPSLIGMESTGGIHEMIFQSIRKSPLESRANLYSNIVLSGGSSCFPGLSERLYTELSKLVPSQSKLQITSNETDRRYSPWIGASMISQLSTFKDQVYCISKLDHRSQ